MFPSARYTNSIFVRTNVQPLISQQKYCLQINSKVTVENENRSTQMEI